MIQLFDRILPRRIWNRILTEPNTGCWLWLGSISEGYGRVTIDGHQFQIHRLLFMLAYGPIPAHLDLDHKCRMTCCCNPEHLDAITPGEHARRTRERIARLGSAPYIVGDTCSIVPLIGGKLRGQNHTGRYDHEVERLRLTQEKRSGRRPRGPDKKPRHRRPTSKVLWSQIQTRIGSIRHA